MSENNRGSFSSNIGFLLAAIGSAVGLGNLWGFPYKMGKSGGFTFLLVYIALAILVGMIIMVSELALGRKTGLGAIGAYQQYSKRYKWLGWLGVIAPFLIMSFYSVLGGYCIQYMSLNLAELSFGLQDALNVDFTGDVTFGAMLTNPIGCVFFTFAFLVVCWLINRGGVSGGIEKFNAIGMPALAVMLLIIIVRALTMDGAVEGLKFMFVPGYAVEAGFIEEAPSLLNVLGTAGGQMFFSLSLAMGAMITYGSYLSKKENLKKNSIVVVAADTIVALMAGLAVIPAAVANGIANGTAYGSIALGGPKLLFVTLQTVFADMGRIGSLFGVIFYALVLIAAISSAISLIEVVSAYFLDKSAAKGKTPNRNKVVTFVCLAILAEATLVAWDGLGEAGIAPANILGLVGTEYYMTFTDCWLDFMDFWSEGLAMPIGAMLMCMVVGWEMKPGSLMDEMNIGGTIGKGFETFYKICIKFVTPLLLILVLAGQITDFVGCEAFPNISTVAYIVSGVILIGGFLLAVLGKKKAE